MAWVLEAHLSRIFTLFSLGPVPIPLRGASPLLHHWLWFRGGFGPRECKDVEEAVSLQHLPGLVGSPRRGAPLSRKVFWRFF